MGTVLSENVSYPQKTDKSVHKLRVSCEIFVRIVVL